MGLGQASTTTRRSTLRQWLCTLRPGRVSRLPQPARSQRSRARPRTPHVLPPACDPSGEERRREALPAPLMRKSLSWESAVLPRPRGRGLPSAGSSGAAVCGESPMAGQREDAAAAATNPEGKGAEQAARPPFLFHLLHLLHLLLLLLGCAAAVGAGMCGVT